jgi:hypothetical protein
MESMTIPRGASEVQLIPENDLELLRSFDGRGNITLSAYLRLDTAKRRESAYDMFMQQIQVQMDECDTRPECRDALKEDMEIVGMYLQTNGHRRHPGLAIFSCASELFWRAYALPVSVPDHIAVGPRFDLEPLLAVAS